MWIPGYITNGLGDHTLEQAILLLEESGYSAIGITLGPTHLDPEQVKSSELESLQQRLKDSGLKPSIETGGRYLLDHKRKHWPSLVSPEEKHRQIRQQSYIKAIDIAAAIGAEVVSLWSGRLESGSDSAPTLEGMISALEPVLQHALEKGVMIGFEPEPGMFIESLSDWIRLKAQLPHPALGLTVDLGHLGVTEASDPSGALESVVSEITHVHIDDCKGGVHEHLPLGEGELDFSSLLGVLTRGDYSGQVLVELSRDSHRAPELVQSSIRFLEGARSKESPGSTS